GAMSAFVVIMQIGMWFGYITFGFVSDALGRKRTYITYLLTAAGLLFIYASVRVPAVLLLLGPFVAFFATGYFSGFGAVTAEIYPTAIRASAQGFTYNIGRIASAAALYAVGSLAQTHGFGPALTMCSAAFVLAACTPGARFFFNPIRKGSEASDESVIDLMTGAPLKFEEITGQQARDAGLARADLDTHYIKVTLARPVPDGGGEARIRILKTYNDAKSYYREGDAVVF